MCIRDKERDGRGEQRGRRRAPGRGGAGGKGPRGRVITCFRLGGAQRGRKTRPGGRAGRWLPYVCLLYTSFGPATEALVRGFQRHFRLAEDGAAGRDTWGVAVAEFNRLVMRGRG